MFEIRGLKPHIARVLDLVRVRALVQKTYELPKFLHRICARVFIRLQGVANLRSNGSAYDVLF